MLEASLSQTKVLLPANDACPSSALVRPPPPAPQGHTSPTWALVFHPTDPLLLASGGSDQSVRLWRLVAGGAGEQAHWSTT